MISEKQKEDERTERLQDYLVCFSTPAGKRVLEDLRKAYQDRSSYVSGDSHETSYREGKRFVYLAICSLIEQAKRPEPKPTKGE